MFLGREILLSVGQTRLEISGSSVGMLSIRPGQLELINDLWKYNITSNEWTWVRRVETSSVRKAPTARWVWRLRPTFPGRDGIRLFGRILQEGGNLWLFGGSGLTTRLGQPGDLNDLWKYNITSNEWTWVSGLNLISQARHLRHPGYGCFSQCSWGTQRLHGAVSWIDALGNLWLFGGFGLDSEPGQAGS